MQRVQLKLYNSLSRKTEAFKPLKKGRVSIYSCGPTVYQYAHVGNLRAYLATDILRRVLEYDGLRVRHVMNITDVGHLTSDADTGEDKVEVAAKRTGRTAKEITKFYADQFVKDIRALNIELPVKFAWASRYIKEQIELVKRLEKKGYTYKTSDGIYFDTAKFKGYGKLGTSGLAGKRVSRVAHSREKKRATDFALWKLSGSKKRQQEWKSPWGVGYPGWHIECSAISTRELGQPFDIHTGGEDHILIHHNDEIAQSEAAYSKPLAHYWFHNAFMVVNKKKMAKSAGNFYTLSDLGKQGIEPIAFRYLAASSHYRQKLNFSKSALVGAQNSLNKLRVVFFQRKHRGRTSQVYRKRFLAAINSDLNMPKAIMVVWDLVKSKKPLADKQATLLNFDRVLGLGLEDYKPVTVPAKVKALVRERESAREAGDWEKADKLRAQIVRLGFAVKDMPSGSRIYGK
ncbi:cysteine--tRNA ligase [candidate division Kazan bacterium RBG_13_50_9]|uniref:Cysteine--tRNA ligase n=1 Tax=candidate division Kazan bacterium RBG_13_50_9 TaxID=1798535 RepID=A0A1F4NRD1_UNCK3|nr:MAG: cysteine--tRNA ligase [candidate division Kazan bacterium RBG_13_50_9]